MFRLARRLGALRRLDGERRAALLRALPVALAIELGLRTLPLPRLARLLGVPVATSPEPASSEGAAPPPGFAAIAFAADALYRRRSENGRCLRRCLLAGHLMRRSRPRLRIGARRNQGRIEAHAWLELGGQKLDLERRAASPEGSPVSPPRFTPLRHAGT
jgi:hypothetical protein